jgi:replicative DNA helicase Mcm
MEVVQDDTLVMQLEDFYASKYKRQIEKLCSEYPQQRSLEVDYIDLDRYSPELADELIQNPDKVIMASEKAVGSIASLTIQDEKPEVHVRFTNIPREYNFMIRDLTSDLVNKFVSFEGIVTKITDIMPKVKVAVFECRRCGRIYRMLQTEKNQLVSPIACACDHKDFNLLVDESKFIDVQKAEVQEPIELLRGGEQAKHVVVWLDDDVTNKLTPGDKLVVDGILRIHQPKKTSAIYNKFIELNSYVKSDKEFEELELSPQDMEEIEELSKNPEMYTKIIKSIAPSIFGYDEVKEAIALQLVGGAQNKKLPDGSPIRPDIHILLIGDPGVAKTRMLQYVDMIAPKSIYVSGKSVSGVGLTASAEKDEFGEGGWTLKAGAIVLAAGGAIMIDEFDKMTDDDRGALHEAMESQTISVAKAGMVTRFKANTAILAAANPKYGRFDPFQPPAEQFDIPPTLLSRFDLIFPVKDILEEHKDRELADHILKSHRATEMRAHNELLKEGKFSNEEIIENEKQVLPSIPPEILRRYIAYARRSMNPVLSIEALERIKAFYVDLRKAGEKSGSIPITPRQLEALVRMAEASAKVRFRDTVTIEDADRAIRLVKYVLREIGMDRETGKLDIDIIATGQPKSKMDRVRQLYRIIKNLNKEKEDVSYEMIIREAETQGIGTDKVDELISILRKNGDIYSPRPGIFRVAEERR